MKILIAYASKYGCTEKCAKALSKKLSGNVDFLDLRRSKNAVDLSMYDGVIIGGSIYMGRIQKQVSEFCDRNLNELTNKRVGLFICCMAEGKVAQQELGNVFPQRLLDGAIAKEYFGGEFVFKKMNPMYRLIVKKMAQVDGDVSNILEENIDRFVQFMNNA